MSSPRPPNSSSFTINKRLNLQDEVSFEEERYSALNRSVLANFDQYQNGNHCWISYTFVTPNGKRWWMTASHMMSDVFGSTGIYLWSELSEQEFNFEFESTTVSVPVPIMTGTPIVVAFGSPLQEVSSQCFLEGYVRADDSLLSRETFKGEKELKFWFRGEPVAGAIFIGERISGSLA